MKSFLSNPIDRTIVAMATAVLLASTYLIVDDRVLFEYSGFSEGELQEVAVVGRADKDVRRRLHSDLAWFPISTEQKIFSGDSIFTGSESEAELFFGDGSKFVIDPGSLVVIRQHQDGTPIVDVESGSVAGALSNQAEQEVQIRVKGTPLKINGPDSQLKIRVRKGKAPEIKVTKGQVELEGDESTTTIKSGESAQLGQGDVKIVEAKQVSLELISPRDNTTLTGLDLQGLEFRWLAEGPAKEFELLVAEDQAFSKIILQQVTQETRHRPGPLPAGRVFYWKVLAKENSASTATSPIYRFQILDENTPTLVAPLHQAKIYFTPDKSVGRSIASKRDKAEVKFEWSQIDEAEKYQIQVSRDAGFKDQVYTQESKTHLLGPVRFPAGSYYWRVRVAGATSISPWSEVFRFAVEPKALEAPPTILAPQAREDLMFSPGQSQIEFLWEVPYIANQFELVVAKTPTFEPKSIVLQKTTDNTGFVWEAVPPGIYYWKVRALIRENEASQFSPTTIFRARIKQKLPAPRIKESYKELEVRNLQGPPKVRSIWLELVGILIETAHAQSPPEERQLIPLIRWPPVNKALKYRLEISPTEDFETVVVRTDLTENQYKWRSYQPGLFYWRVCAVDQNGDLGEWSTQSAIKISLAPPTSPKEQKIEVPILVEEDLAKPPPRFKLQWGPKKMATAYEIQIDKTADFPTPEVQTTNQSSIEITPRGFGKKFWRVRPLSADKKPLGRFSEPRTIELKAVYKLQAPPNPNPINTSYLISNETPQPPTLTWDPVNLAKGYRVEISNRDDFSVLIDSDLVYETSFNTIKNVPAGAMHWRVRAERDDSKSDWTQSYVFIVKRPRLLPAPVGLIPSSGVLLGGNTSALTQFRWQPVEGAKSYLVEISNEPTLTRIVQTVHTVNSWETVSLPPGFSYFWKVTAAEALPRSIASIGDSTLKTGKPSQSAGLQVLEGESLVYGFSTGLISSTVTQTTSADSVSSIYDGTLKAPSLLTLGGEVDYWRDSHYGVHGEAYYTTGKATYSSSGDAELTQSRFELMGRAQYRRFFSGRLSAVAGMGIRMKPSPVVNGRGSSASLQSASSWGLTEHLAVHYDPQLGKYSVRGGLNIEEKFPGVSKFGLSPFVEGRYRTPGHYYGLEISLYQDGENYAQRTVDATAVGNVEYKGSELRILLKAGFWK